MMPRSQIKPWKMILIFIAPVVLYYCIFIVYPLIATVVNSLMQISPGPKGLVSKFVGLRNFRELLHDEIFFKAASNTLVWAIVGPALEMVTASALAFIVFFKVPFASFYRVAWFSPMLVTGVVVGLIFKWIFNADWGLVNTGLRAIGLGVLAVNWFGNMTTPLWVVIMVHFWNTMGYTFVIILAGLSAVPAEVLESASLDGANKFQLCIHVLFPLIFPVFSTAFMLSFLGKMRAFNVVWVLTEGGPMHASETVATYIQKRAFQWGSMDLGYPSAISVVWFVLVLLGVNLISRWVKSRTERYV